MAIEYETSSTVNKVLMKAWTSMMMLSTGILGFFAFVLNDNSVVPIVALGIFGLSLPMIVGVIRTIVHYRKIQEEAEEIKRKAEIERLRQAREMELKQSKFQKIYAEKEAAEEEALKNAMSNIKIMKE